MGLGAYFLIRYGVGVAHSEALVDNAIGQDPQPPPVSASSRNA
jgi:hypothetical protein